MKKLLKEFQEFINRGNVMDMAIGVIIGGAFTAIVTSLTDNIINPLIKAVCGGNVGEVSGLVIPGTEIDFGAFISAVINFLIVAAIVFAMVKALNKAQDLGNKLAHKQPEEEPAPAPVCPFCLEEVNPGATKCCHSPEHARRPVLTRGGAPFLVAATGVARGCTSFHADARRRPRQSVQPATQSRPPAGRSVAQCTLCRQEARAAAKKRPRRRPPRLATRKSAAAARDRDGARRSLMQRLAPYR